MAQVSEEKCTVFGVGTDFRGKVQFKTALVIQGNYEGRVQAEGDLIVDSKATVKADIVAKSLLVSGSVIGNIKISGHLDITGTGKVFGDINILRLHVEKGAVLKGRISMIKDPDSLDIFSLPPEQLKKIIEE